MTDPGGLSDTDSVVVTVSASPPNKLPVPVIDAPSSSFTWAVDDPIQFAGGASDAEDGTSPRAGSSWTLILHHCVTGGDCHEHEIEQQRMSPSGTFDAPDHEYPSHLELRLTATDSDGGSASTSVLLQPETVELTFTSASATGLQLVVSNVQAATPFTRTVIVNSRFTATAVTPQTVGPTTSLFESWSDGGAASHEITAPPTATSYTATYVPQPTRTFTPVADASVRGIRPAKNYGGGSRLSVRAGYRRSYIRFVVSGVTGTVTDVKMRLRVTDPSSNAGDVYLIGKGWKERVITWKNAPLISGTPVATIGPTTDHTWAEVDLTSVVTGNGKYRLVIAGGNSDMAKFASREATSQAAARHHDLSVGVAASDRVVNAPSGMRGHVARWGGLIISAVALPRHTVL